MVCQYLSKTPGSCIAAMAILTSLPTVILFFLQRWNASGLAVSAVKG